MSSVGAIATGSQYAALPWRWIDGHLEILLITTLTSKCWIVPKGWPIDGCSPSECAAQEAFEEAGISAPRRQSLSARSTIRSAERVATRSCHADVFDLEVERQRRAWPEKAVRKTCWFTVEEALARVSDPGLRRLIERFAKKQMQIHR